VSANVRRTATNREETTEQQHESAETSSGSLVQGRERLLVKPLLKYIELKSGFADNGPAWVARVETSKSGRTIYFNGRALKRVGKSGVRGNHVDLESGDEYWVSSVKKNGEDRHWAGSGKISVEASAVAEYLACVRRTELDLSRFVIVPDLPRTDRARFEAFEHQVIE
jgi:hypothetical protein